MCLHSAYSSKLTSEWTAQKKSDVLNNTIIYKLNLKKNTNRLGDFIIRIKNNKVFWSYLLLIAQLNSLVKVRVRCGAGLGVSIFRIV